MNNRMYSEFEVKQLLEAQKEKVIVRTVICCVIVFGLLNGLIFLLT